MLVLNTKAQGAHHDRRSHRNFGALHKRRKVRIGIEAPREVPVFRKAVHLEIQQGNVAAGTSARAEASEALKRLAEG